MRSGIAVLSFLGLFVTGVAFAQQTATPDQQAILRQFGISSNLVDANIIQKLTGGCAQNPYPILEQYKAGSNVHVTPVVGANGTTFEAGINSVLACRLSQFLVYAQQSKGCKFTIASAYRSAQEQANICGNGGPNCGTPGRSCHQYGLAVDLTSSASCMQWAKSFLGTKNNGAPGGQQFKIQWPISTDDGHTQCLENTVGNCTPQTQGCDGSGGNINPNLNYIAPVARSPLGALGYGLGGLLMPPQPMMCPPGSMLMNGSCLPQQAMSAMQTQNPYSYLSSTPPSSVTPSSGVTPSTTGTTGSTNTNTNSNTNASSVIGNLGSNVLGNGDTNVDVSGMLNGGSQGDNGSSTSAIDLINQIANPTTTDDGSPSPQQATGTPVQLGSNLNDAVTLHGTPVSLNGTPQSSSTYQLSPAVSQTFVSQDLSKSPVNTYTPQQPVNSTFAILQDLEQKLLYIIAYLKPFGGVTPRYPTATASAAPGNSTTAYME